jgi:hypothetical protein
MERLWNSSGLTLQVIVYTVNNCMGRPPKSEAQRRSKLFPLRLTPGEIAELESASRRLGESVAAIFRKGAKLYVERSKDGSTKRKGNKS